MREIDALDGIMAQTRDRSGIQFRMLNKSRGPAVQARHRLTVRSTAMHTRYIGWLSKFDNH